MADLVAEIAVSEAKFRQQTRKVFDDALRATTEFEREANAKLAKFGDGFSKAEFSAAQQRQLTKLKREFDPLYVAAERYKGALERLNTLQATPGKLSADAYTMALRRINLEYKNATDTANQVGASAGRMGGQLQNIGFQIGDFATQVGAGTSATQALGQQLPQLLGGFGAIGAVAGAAAAIMIPLGAALFRAAGDSETLEDRMKGLTASTDAMVDAAENAARPIHELRSAFGGLADEIARADQAQAMFARIRAENDLIGTSRAIAKQFGSLAPVPSAVQPDGSFDPTLSRARDAQIEAMRKLRMETGATEEQAEALRKVLQRMGEENTPQAIAAAMADYEAILADIANTGDVSEKQMKRLNALAVESGAVRAQAERQASAAMTEAQKIIDRYAGTTRELRGLADEREVAERALAQAQKDGNAQLITDLREVLTNIDRQIDKTKELARETDLAFKGMSRAYQEYAQSRMEGQAWANSPAGFEAQYVAQRAAGSGSQDEELVRAVSALAEQMGIAAQDLLAVMSFETGGKLRPDVMGPTTKNGQHFGLIQFGDKGAGPRYGVTPNSSITEQVIAAGRYLQDAGVKAGDSLANIYAAVLSGDARKVHASDLAAGGVVGDVSEATGGAQFEGHIARAQGLLAAYGGTVEEVAEAQRDLDRASAESLRKDVAERERQKKAVEDYGATLAKNLVTAQQDAELTRQRAEALQAIEASGIEGPAKAAAIAEVNGEYEKQRLILTLIEDAKRRQVDLDTLMTGSTMTYAQAIAALGDAAKQAVVADQERKTAMEELAERQAFYNDLQGQMKNGLIDAIVAGESFADVLANVAQMLAKAALQAALFGEGPFGNGGGGLLGGLFGGLFKGFAGGGYTGSGGKYQPAGIVHRGEYVMDAETVRAAGGPQSLDMLRRSLRGYADGGYVGSEIIVPRSAGTVIPSHRLGGGGMTYAPVFHVGGHVTAEDLARVRQEALTHMEIMQKSLPAQVQKISAQPRRRY